MTPLPKNEWDTTGAEMNRLWREQQKPAEKPRHDVTARVKQPVTHPTTPQKQPDQHRGPPECDGCEVRQACRAVLKLWSKHRPRTELAQAWHELIQRNRAAMRCLRDASTDEHKFSLRDEK